MSIRLVLLGAAGRMGRAVEAAARERGGFEIMARVDPSATGLAGYSGELAPNVTAGDVVVDFTSPEGAREAARVCAERKAALVTGTTGLAPGDHEALAAAARQAAILHAANFSLGVAVLRRALAAALAAAPSGWDVEIVERHHRRKADSPSGTALMLAREVAARRGLDESAFRNGRSGRLGPRPAAEIGLHALRGGTWVGDHTVLLAGEGEWIELRHVASDRAAFAHGALAAARFVAAARPGLYNLDDCLAALESPSA